MASNTIPTCPRCGSSNIVKDAVARWDDEQQAWDLCGVQDCETCEDCGAEGNFLSARPLPAVV